MIDKEIAYAMKNLSDKDFAKLAHKFINDKEKAAWKNDSNIWAWECEPVIKERRLEGGILETVRIHGAWASSVALDILVPIFGKLHYFWKKGNDQVSCIQRLEGYIIPYKNNKRIISNSWWEICHPEGRYDKLKEAKAATMEYFGVK